MKKGMSKKLQKKIEDCGWNVEQVNETEWEIESSSPLGEDLVEYINGENDEEIIADIERLASNFDVDDHVELYVGMRGTRGVPNSISALVKDAEDIQEMLDDLAMAVNK